MTVATNTRRSAGSYHEAMTLCPEARRFELEYPLQLAAPRNGDVVIDFPSGGSYLKPYLEQLAPTAQLYAVEEVAEYGDMVPDISTGTWEHLNFEDGSADILVCLASLHHLYSGRERFYKECRRIFRPGGRLIIGDVAEGTNADRFLSEFVNRHSPEGHVARFFREHRDRLELESAGFDVSHWEVRDFTWRYPNRRVAIEFCRGLFRLGCATDAQIWDGLDHYLGLQESGEQIEMGWQLAFIRAEPVSCGST